jgi:glycerol uptake facilitator-like aquaporin
MSARLARPLLAEFLGSAFLAAVVIGSGIAAQQLSPGNVGLQLLENAAATATGLFMIILMFGPVSGAHFNPVVSRLDATFGGIRWRDAAAYVPAQIGGCIVGAIVANTMFAQAAVKHLDQAPRLARASVRGGDRNAGIAAGDLLARAHPPRREHTRGGRRLHRRRVLLHELHELCQPGDQRLADVL